MARRRPRSEQSKAGASSRAKSRSDNQAEKREHAGWAVDADPEEDIFFRRVLFSVLVVVVACVGAWFLVTTVSDGRAGRPVLSVDSTSPGASSVYTVMLLDLPASGRETAMQLVAKESLRALAGEHLFDFVELPDGRLALCVGCFDSEDSAQLRDLLGKFRRFDERGRRPFQSALIHSYAK